LCDTLTPEGFFVAQVLADISKPPHDAHANGLFCMGRDGAQNGGAEQQSQHQQYAQAQRVA
jgi:hypothetical protein